MGLNESEYPGEQPKSSDLMLAMKDASDSEAGNELEEERRLFQLMKTLNIGLKMGGLHNAIGLRHPASNVTGGW